MDRRKNLTAMVLSTAILFCSCASQSPKSAQVPSFEYLAFVAPEDLSAINRPETETEALDKSVHSGAAIGTVGGAAVGAAACGPVFYGACVAIFSGYGLVAGSLGGAAVGLYNYSGLSNTDLAYMAEVLSRIEATRSFQKDLREQVERQVHAEMIVAPADADIQVIVRVDRINFAEVEKELISTELYGTMILAWVQGSGERMYRATFTASAPAADIDDLIADDGRLLEDAIDRCLSQIAEQMGSTLVQSKNGRPNSPKM